MDDYREWQRESQTEKEWDELDKLAEDNMKHISNYLDINNFMVGTPAGIKKEDFEAMNVYSISTSLDKMSQDDIHELIGELRPITKMNLYKALYDQMDHED